MTVLLQDFVNNSKLSDGWWACFDIVNGSITVDALRRTLTVTADRLGSKTENTVTSLVRALSEVSLHEDANLNEFRSAYREFNPTP